MGGFDRSALILGDPGADRGAGGKLGRAETTTEREGAGRKGEGE